MATGDQITAEAEKFSGYPYVWGGTSPAGFDCSGLVAYVLGQEGVKGVPRTSEAQWQWVAREPASSLAPGDLVFAQFPGDNASPGHVGFYVGNGQVLSAEDPAHGVATDTLADWGNAIVGYGRAPGSAAGTGASTSSYQNVQWWNPASWLNIPGDAASSAAQTVTTEVVHYGAIALAVLLGLGLVGLGLARATHAAEHAQNTIQTAAPLAAAAAL